MIMKHKKVNAEKHLPVVQFIFAKMYISLGNIMLVYTIGIESKTMVH